MPRSLFPAERNSINRIPQDARLPPVPSFGRGGSANLFDANAGDAANPEVSMCCRSRFSPAEARRDSHIVSDLQSRRRRIGNPFVTGYIGKSLKLGLTDKDELGNVLVHKQVIIGSCTFTAEAAIKIARKIMALADEAEPNRYHHDPS